MRLPGSKIALSGKPNESGDFKRGEGEEREKDRKRERGREREVKLLSNSKATASLH